jgi:hypothetical protein
MADPPSEQGWRILIGTYKELETMFMLYDVCATLYWKLEFTMAAKV